MNSRFLVLGSSALTLIPVFGAQNEATPIGEEGDQTILTASMFSFVHHKFLKTPNFMTRALAFFPGFGERPKSLMTSRQNPVTHRSHDLDKTGEMDKRTITDPLLNLDTRGSRTAPLLNPVTHQSHDLDKSGEMDKRTITDPLLNLDTRGSRTAPLPNLVIPGSHASDEQIQTKDIRIPFVSNVPKNKPVTLKDILEMYDNDDLISKLNQSYRGTATQLQDVIVSTDVVQRFILKGQFREALSLMKALKNGGRVKFQMSMRVLRRNTPCCYKKLIKTSPQTGNVMEKVIPIREAEFSPPRNSHFLKYRRPGKVIKTQNLVPITEAERYKSKEGGRDDELYIEVDSILLLLAKAIPYAMNSKGELPRDVISSCWELMKFASFEEFSTECDEMDGIDTGYRIPITKFLLLSVGSQYKKEFEEKIAELSKTAQKRGGSLSSIYKP